MFNIIKERYLNKIVSLEKFDDSIRNLLMIRESDSIMENNILEVLHNGFLYETFFSDNIGFDFKFKLVRSDPKEKEIFVKIIDVEEV